ncbi:MAG: undecaprenyl-diphosphate phosphatase [bacterium]
MNQGMEVIKASIVGIVQGLTEFLPVSSSGHMVIIQHLLGIDEKGISIEILSHLATALVVILFLRKTIWGIINSLHFYIRGRKSIEPDSNLRLLLLLIVASIPAAVVGISLKAEIENLFEAYRITSFMLIVTGCFLLVCFFSRPKRVLIRMSDALVIGLAQAAAIVPGISRSGLTIGTALLLGIERSKAFEFSILLSLPAILGASLIDAVWGASYSQSAAVAAAVAFFSGYFGLKWLRRWVIQAYFPYFSLYVIPVGILMVILLG